MGNCLSSKEADGGSAHRTPRANVVTDTGELRQFSLPITASQVLESLSSSPESFFLCNSDRLYFDQHIPALDPGEELQAGQIYFLLPASKLNYTLAATDMAALAVKASLALEKINGSSSRRKSKARISPVAAAEEDPQSNHTVSNTMSKAKKGGSVGPDKVELRSGSVRKLKRYSSRRAKLAVRSFRMKLSTISEGSSFRGTPS